MQISSILLLFFYGWQFELILIPQFGFRFTDEAREEKVGLTIMKPRRLHAFLLLLGS
jgi:hypothetical protein